MRAKFHCTQVAENHAGDKTVTLAQIYDHTARDLNDSTNPEGQIVFNVTDKSGFFQLGHKYFVNFVDEAPAPREYQAPEFPARSEPEPQPVA